MFLTPVDVHVPVGGDDADAGAGPASTDLDLFVREGEFAAAGDAAHGRLRRVDRLAVLIEPDAHRPTRRHRCRRLVTLGRREVPDRLMRSLAVVVEPEPVEELLEVREITGGAFVGEPLLECAMEPLELAQCLGVIGGRVDQLDVELVRVSVRTRP